MIATKHPTLLGVDVVWVGSILAGIAALAVIFAIYAAVTVRDVDELTAAVGRLLGDAVERAARAAAAAGIAADNRAVLDAVLQRIAPWLDRLSAHA